MAPRYSVELRSLLLSGRPVDPEFANVARRTREEHEGRHVSKLMDPAELPRR